MLEVVVDELTIGINYPWLSCGHDFGPGPPAWGAKARGERRYERVARDLDRLRSIGVDTLRWWVLAGGVNYPVAAPTHAIGSIVEVAAPQCREARPRRLALLARFAGRRTEVLDPPARYVPPPLPAEFIDDFLALLRVCARCGVRVLPSLLSFELFQPLVRLGHGVSKRGRERLVFGGEADPQRMQRFLDGTLSPLLEASRDHADAIYAWELINEPEWAVIGGPIHLDIPHYGWGPVEQRIPRAWMSALIDEGVRRIVDSGFVATVGFANPSVPWLARSTMDRLGRWAAEGRYLHQRHHYPALLGDRTLPTQSESPIVPCLLGEIPTSMGGTPSNLRWRDRELRATERDPKRYLHARIELARERGYRAVFLWAERATDARARLHREPLSEDEIPRRDRRAQRPAD